MEKTVDVVFDIWKSHENYLGIKPYTGPAPNIAGYLANLFCPGAYYYYIIDSPTLTFDIVSDTTQQLLGISAEDFTLQTLMEIIHPDDIHFMMKCEDVVAHFLKNCVSPEQMVNYKISYCLREKTVNNGYRLFLLQTITMKTTSDGALLKVFGSHTDISHITKVNNKKLSFIGLNGAPSFLEIDVFDKTVLDDYRPFNWSAISKSHPFSNREMEIIKHLAAGLTTEEIAERLFVTNNTVDTHRRNILAKAGSKNTTALVVDCLQKGYI